MITDKELAAQWRADGLPPAEIKAKLAARKARKLAHVVPKGRGPAKLAELFAPFRKGAAQS